MSSLSRRARRKQRPPRQSGAALADVEDRLQDIARLGFLDHDELAAIVQRIRGGQSADAAIAAVVAD